MPTLPTLSTDRPIAVVVAVAEEFRAIAKKMPSAEGLSVGGFPLLVGEIAGRRVVLCKSGMGISKSQKAVHALASDYDPIFYIFFDCQRSDGLPIGAI